jgi:hypothetical protein
MGRTNAETEEYAYYKIAITPLGKDYLKNRRWNLFLDSICKKAGMIICSIIICIAIIVWAFAKKYVGELNEKVQIERNIND